jgi:hypothetical protein
MNHCKLLRDNFIRTAVASSLRCAGPRTEEVRVECSWEYLAQPGVCVYQFPIFFGSLKKNYEAEQLPALEWDEIKKRPSMQRVGP